MMYETCKNGCCIISTPIEFKWLSSNEWYKIHDKKPPPYKKSGFIIQDINDDNYILLVQSCGNFWGFPKGSLENIGTKEEESYFECAIRELKEETGIEIKDCDHSKIDKTDIIRFGKKKNCKIL